MADELAPDSAELDGYRFGGLPPEGRVVISNVLLGAPDVVSNDRQLPRSDGVRHSREYRGGRTIGFELHVVGNDAPDGLNALDALTTAWDADQVRKVPGRVSTLRLRNGNRVRRVYGRARNFLPDIETIGMDGIGLVACEFRTQDHLVFDDVENANTVGIVPPAGGGLVAPLSSPLGTVAISYAPGEIVVGGTVPCWPVFIIQGPISLPTIEVVGEFKVTLAGRLREGEFVVVDPRPWSRGVRVNGVSSVAGALTPRSPRLADVRLKPGAHEVILSGLDETGTATMTVAWRDTYTSF